MSSSSLNEHIARPLSKNKVSRLDKNFEEISGML